MHVTIRLRAQPEASDVAKRLQVGTSKSRLIPHCGQVIVFIGNLYNLIVKYSSLKPPINCRERVCPKTHLNKCPQQPGDTNKKGVPPLSRLRVWINDISWIYYCPKYVFWMAAFYVLFIPLHTKMTENINWSIYTSCSISTIIFITDTICICYFWVSKEPFDFT